MTLNGSFTNHTNLLPRNLPGMELSRPVSVSALSVVGQSSILVVAMIVLTGIWIESNWYRLGRAKNFPPGPRSNLETFWKLRYFLWYKSLDLQFKTLIAEYGKVIGCFLNFFRVVVINDPGVLKVAFNNSVLLGRPPQKFMYMFGEDRNRGLALTSGETWREIRKFTVSQLRSLGLGKKTLEPAISQQVEECIAILRTKINQPFSSKHFFDILSFNVLWEMIASQKFSPGDPQAQNLIESVARFVNAGFHGALFNCQPKFGTWLLSILGISNPFVESNKQFLKFTSEFLNTRLKSFASTTSSDDYDDFTQAFLHKIHSTKDINSPFYGQTGYENLQETIRDFFIAGIETSGTTLSWALLFLALHPEKQEKLQREIDYVLGDRPPTLQDRTTMKYTEAVINETLRKSSNAPFGVPHAATEDTTIGQFSVPKGTMVLSNTYAIHHCEETWGDPHEFRPERFLSEDETTLIKHDALVAFGIGKRICPGAALAYDELFLFIARIFQEFTITWNPWEPKPTIGFKFGCAASPLPHTLIIKERVKGQVYKRH